MRSCKRVFYAVIGTCKLTDEILANTFCLVEQSLNACPILPVGPNLTELEALTPNHFLLGEHSVSFPSQTLDVSFDHRTRYVRAQAYAKAFWQRWLKKFVPSINKR